MRAPLHATPQSGHAHTTRTLTARSARHTALDRRPSFRPAEVVTENVVTDMTTGYVTSKCGTHLGSYLPDAQGPRWCMDLSCIAGGSAV